MKLLLGAFVCFLTCCLCACGPVYETQYQYKSPGSGGGKMCVAQCIQGKSMCEQMCQMNEENCRSRARQDAFYQFDLYKQERKAAGKPIKKSISDFDQGWLDCKKSCDCENTYRMCYQNCGGEVTAKKVCVAFCDKQ